MIKEIHFLLTYTCNYMCDHCFLFSGPDAPGTFTISQIKRAFDEISKVKTIKKVYFEGGEPFLYYPLMLEAIRIACDQGLKVGIVTNSYWANSVEDAEIWLRPLKELGVSDISMSDDKFHGSEEGGSPPKLGIKAAKNLCMRAGSISIDEPRVKSLFERVFKKGESIIGGGVMFRGRATETLIDGLPGRACDELTTCPYEDIETPGRVHIDPYGNLHACQGLLIGNIYKDELSEIIDSFDPKSHPVIEPLIKGGPLQIAREYDLPYEDSYVDECHFCFSMRKVLLDRFPEYLAPTQVYGL
jgi:MoaA/NifB/PqqE/SkfB family radical SAM enzyme